MGGLRQASRYALLESSGTCPPNDADVKNLRLSIQGAWALSDILR